MAQFNQHPATIKFKINLAMAGIKFSKSGLSKKSTLAVAKLGALTLFAGSAASTKQLGIGNILGWLCSQGFKGGKNKQCC